VDQPLTIAVASFYKPLVARIEQALQGMKAIVVQVAPNDDSVLKALHGSQSQLVVLHERKDRSDWLDLANTLRNANPRPPLVDFAESSDVEVVARGIVSGSANFVPLANGTSPHEIKTIIVDAISGREPSPDCLYGRVKAMLPKAPAEGGKYVCSSGRFFSAQEAMEHCLGLGLTPDETAGFLGVSPRDTNKADRRTRRRPRVGMSMPSLPFSRVGRLAISAIAVGAIALLVSRQGPPPLPYELAPVSGTVTLDGQPVSQGLVRLTPDGTRATKGPSGIGVIDAQGTFRVVTAGHDGAVVGSHRVSVLPTELRQSDPTKYVSQAMPTRYTRNKTSGLSCEVQSGRPNHLALKLITPNTETRAK